jgi:uncharacterized protein RhaS with RHS repeats
MSYSPTTGRWLERDPVGYVDGLNLYEALKSNPTNYLDPMGTQIVDPAREKDLWDKQKAAADAALNFWKDFLNLQENGNPVSAGCLAKMLDMIRAISSVESQHGTAGANQPGRDPMQSGNPRDAWWGSLTGNENNDRIIGGPGKGNWWLQELPGATGKPAPAGGHDDASFTPDMSYMWGVLAFIQKMNMNGNNGDRTYKCGDCSDERLFKGALDYNGGGDPNYGEKLKKALAAIGSKIVPPA